MNKKKMHWLRSCKYTYLAGLHYPACDTVVVRCTRDRDKDKGSFSRKDVTCENCKKTKAFKNS